MKINILTIFPDMFAPLRQSMLGRAIDKGIIELSVTDIRDYTADKHNRVDDIPYGGGAGMVMQVQPILDAYRSSGCGGEFLYMSPRGEMLTGAMAKELSEMPEITILCGHYEGVDQRVLDMLDAREVSIGDYVLSSGVPAAMVICDAVIRLLPGVLGDDESSREESHSDGLLEYGQYTRPPVYRGMAVPEILLSGDHGKIAKYRRSEMERLTRERRPDLWKKFLSQTEKEV
jgi:tRNA (guanine37-N1)-methyltransferase